MEQKKQTMSILAKTAENHPAFVLTKQEEKTSTAEQNKNIQRIKRNAKLFEENNLNKPQTEELGL